MMKSQAQVRQGSAARTRTAVGALLVAVAVLALVGATPTAARAAGPGALIETVTVQNTSTAPVTSATTLDPKIKYTIIATGTISDWCPATATSAADCSYGSPLAIADGVDAMYCYAAWRCGPTPQPWRQLRVNGQGLDEFAGLTDRVPYTPSHVYQVAFTGKSGRLSFAPADGSPSDNSGAFTVRLYRTAVAQPTRFRISAYANVVRGRPRYQLGRTWVNGAGTISLGGVAQGTIHDRDDPRFYASNSATYRVTGASERTLNGARGLVLRVVVAGANGAACRPGVTGTITIWDNPNRLDNGQRGDGVYIDLPFACRSHVHGFNNLNHPNSEPTRGGPGGGVFAIVTITGGASTTSR